MPRSKVPRGPTPRGATHANRIRHARPPTTGRYAKVIEASKRVRWEIDRDVIRGRRFDYTKTFLPSRLSLVDELASWTRPTSAC